MSGSQTYQRLTRGILDDHQQIRFYFDQVAQSLEKLREGLSDVEPMRRLAAQLQGLKERLDEHQQLEEAGLFPAILELLPARRVDVNRLTSQHRKFIEILELARIHALDSETTEADGLRVDLERYLAMFREHEDAEDRLLQEAIEFEEHPAD